MSTCGSGTRAEDYNLSLHVGALFIILAVSAGACALPIVALRVPQLRIPAKAHFGFRHFGTGVLIATAFVHLIPTAFISLIDPCLPPFFNEDYPALAGAIALAAVFMITIAEMIFSPGRSLCSGPGHDDLSEPAPIDRDGGANVANGTTEATRRHSLANDEITPGEPANCRPNIVRGVDSVPAESTPQFGRSRSGRSHSVMKTVGRRSSLMFNENTFQLTGENKRGRSVDDVEDRRPSEDSMTLAEEKEAAQQRHKLLMQCVLLECGILFHSIFIGLALAVAVGSEQVILLIAIAFHQTFEGLALGSRIAAVGWKPRALQPWFMALAYGCTTPLGQAIGIATRNLYDPDSATGLVVVGTFNAFSAGLLTYTSLVDLLSEDFLSDHSWRTLRGRRRVGAMCLVGFGAFCMSLIGAWA